MNITLEAFNQIHGIVGEVVSCKENLTAKIPAYIIELNMGGILGGIHETVCKKSLYVSSAQLCANYRPEALVGRQLLTIANFPRKQIGKMMSDCLTTGVQKPGLSSDEKRATTLCIGPTEPVPPGSALEIFPLPARDLRDRSLTWEQFMRATLQIGTILKAGVVPQEPKDDRIRIDLLMEFGDGPKPGIFMADPAFSIATLLGREVLALRNLENSAAAIVCSVAGRVLFAADRSAQGYRLA